MFAKKQDADDRAALSAIVTSRLHAEIAAVKFPTLKTLTLRIYLTVVAVLLLFAAVSGWLFQRHMDDERVRAESMVSERMAAWGELIQRSLPGSDASPAEQTAALDDWSQRLRLAMALDDAQGRRIAESALFTRLEMCRVADFRDQARRWPNLAHDAPAASTHHAKAMRRGRGSAIGPGVVTARDRRDAAARRPPDDFGLLPRGIGWLVLLVVLFFAVAGAAWPVARALTRRLAALKLGVERFGSGQLSHRVEVSGQDEVAAVASSFNQAAARIEALVRSHQSLLANASHELRSPLARMKMAIEMLDDAPVEQRVCVEARDRYQHRRARCAGRRGAAGQPARCVGRYCLRMCRSICWRSAATRRPVSRPRSMATTRG